MAKGSLVVSRTDGSRVASLPGMSNVVNEGDSVWVNIIDATPNADLKIKFGGYTDTLRTNQFGNGQELITMKEPGNIGVNVIDYAQSHTFVQTVWVQPKAPTQPSTTPSGSQQGSTTPTTSNQQGQSTTPTTTTTTTGAGGGTVTDISNSQGGGFMATLENAKDWFVANLIPVLAILFSLAMVAIFAGTKAGRKAVQTLAKGAPIKR